MITVTTILSVILTIGVYLCHRYGPDWNYLFGIMFFAGLPAIETGMIGYIAGVSILLFLVIFAMIMERMIAGEWREPRV